MLYHQRMSQKYCLLTTNLLNSFNKTYMILIVALMVYVLPSNAREETVTNSLIDSVSIIQKKPNSKETIPDSLSDSLLIDTRTQKTIEDTAIGEERIDTSFCNWKYPFWGFGAGWELGSHKLFDLWEESQETNRLKTALINQLLIDSIHSVLSVSFIEMPAVYNVIFPLSISYTPFVFKKSYLTLGCSYTWIRKYSHVSFTLDSTTALAISNSTVNLEQRLSVKTLTLNMRYNFLIPDIYFNIEKIKESYITLGISGSPLVVLREWHKNSLKSEEKRNSYGISAGWIAGVATFRRLSSKSSLELGFLYSGTWQGRIIHKGHHIMKSDITKSGEISSDVLQFISHRFNLYFNLILGKKAYREQYKNISE